jgi:hypothetical protein
MKARTLVSICLISGLAAVAQSAPPSQKVAPDSAKPAATKAATAKPMAMPPVAAKPMASPAKPGATQSKPIAAPAKAVAPQAKPASAPKTAMKKPETKAAAKAPVKQAKAMNKRDPFLSPVREGATGPDCNVGKKCLAIDTILLRGIVRAPSGAIAVVESSTRRITYFLRENDPVFNGYVMKITPDTVMFRENVVDRFGKQGTRDIPKRVSAPPV